MLRALGRDAQMRSSVFHHFAARANRRAAGFLVLLWALLWTAQAFAACCLPHDNPVRDEIPSSHPVVSDSARAGHVNPSDREPVCPPLLDEAVPAKAPAALSSGHAPFDFVGAPARAFSYPAPIPTGAPPAESADLPPPRPLYLSLKRFLS